jgi:VCBS repeat-containing protein
VNGVFSVVSPGAAEFGWTVRGAVAVTDGAAVLAEHGRVNTGLSQSFVVPDEALRLRFSILGTTFVETDDAPPDAFEVALLAADSMLPLVGTATGLTLTDALFNLQDSGEVFLAPGVTVLRPDGTLAAGASGDVLDLSAGPFFVEIDLDGVTAGGAATLFFDLLGAGALGSQVTIDNVQILLADDGESVAPSVVAGPDVSVGESATFTGSGSFVDPDLGDTWTATVDYGDGSETQPLALVGTTFQLSHTYADDGEYTVIVTVTDREGGVGADALDVTVLNADPLVDLGADDDGVPRQTPHTHTVTFSDVGTADTHTVDVDWGDGTPGDTLVSTVDASGGITIPLTHVFATTGDFILTVTVTDDDGGIGVDTAVMHVLANRAPEGADDTYLVAEDDVLTVPAGIGLLANDTDDDGDPLAAILVSGPFEGTLTLNSDGSFTYVPDEDFSGVDAFVYRVSDGTAMSAPTAVAIGVTPVNDAPAASGDAYTMDEDGVLSVPGPGLLANDSDVDGDELAAQVTTGPSHGALALNPDGSFTYVPNGNFHGVDTFTYVAMDGAAESAPATVTITVNDVPESPQSVDQFITVSFTGYVLNRATGTFDTRATIVNTSDETLLGPMRLIVTGVNPTSVTLANRAGLTAEGHPYIDVPLPAGGLAPGQSVTGILVRFTNPSRVNFTFTRTVQAVVAPKETPATLPADVESESVSMSVAGFAVVRSEPASPTHLQLIDWLASVRTTGTKPPSTAMSPLWLPQLLLDLADDDDAAGELVPSPDSTLTMPL